MGGSLSGIGLLLDPHAFAIGPGHGHVDEIVAVPGRRIAPQHRDGTVAAAQRTGDQRAAGDDGRRPPEETGPASQQEVQAEREGRPVLSRKAGAALVELAQAIDELREVRSRPDAGVV
jgi:hypothetical protein